MSHKIERRISWIAFILAILVGLLSWRAQGQEKGGEAGGKGQSTGVFAPRGATDHPAPSLTPVQKLELLNTFKSALIGQENAKHAQDRAQQLVQTFLDKQKQLVKDAGYPEGTTFEINQDTDDVRPVPPPKKGKDDAAK